MTKEQCENVKAENSSLMDKYFVQLRSNRKMQLIRMDIKNISDLEHDYYVQCIFKTGDPNLPYFVEPLSIVLQEGFYRSLENHLY